MSFIEMDGTVMLENEGLTEMIKSIFGDDIVRCVYVESLAGVSHNVNGLEYDDMVVEYSNGRLVRFECSEWAWLSEVKNAIQ